MDNRSFEAGAAASVPTAPASPSVGYPSDGNPLLGQPACVPGAYWFHQIGEELRGVITGSGLTPNASSLNQLVTAINNLISAGAPAAALAKAWITFDGTSGGGVLDSHNVASFTRTSAGLYTVTFASGLFANANYGVVSGNTAALGGTNLAVYAPGGPGGTPALKTTTGCSLVAGDGTVVHDVKYGCLIFFGN